MVVTYWSMCPMIHIIMETGGQLNVLGLEAGTIMGDVTLFSFRSALRREPASPSGKPKNLDRAGVFTERV